MFGDQRRKVSWFNSRTPRIVVAERLTFYRVAPLEDQCVQSTSRSRELMSAFQPEWWRAENENRSFQESLRSSRRCWWHVGGFGGRRRPIVFNGEAGDCGCRFPGIAERFESFQASLSQ